MRVSSNFQRFIFSFIADLHEQMIQAKRVLMSIEKFRDTLKYLDHDYPKHKSGNAYSYTYLSNKQFLAHIEFLVKWSGEYGITPKFVQREWDRLLQEAHA